MTRIFFYGLRPYDELPLAQRFAAAYGIPMAWTEALPSAENAVLAKGCEVVCCTPCRLPASLLAAFASGGCRVVVSRAIGYDWIDLDACRALGLKVYHAQYPPDGVADYAVMLLVMAVRKMGQILARAAVQDYSLEGKMGRSLHTMTVGVVGCGRIGRAVLKRLSGFGCNLLACDPHPTEEAEALARFVTLDELARESDAVTLHVAATTADTHLLGSRFFAAAKPGLVVVNTSRGQLVDTGALLDALESGKVGAAALDVQEGENGIYYFNRMGEVIPNRNLMVLKSLPNVILSPHAAFYTDEDMDAEIRSVFEGVDAWMRRRPSALEVRLSPECPS